MTDLNVFRVFTAAAEARSFATAANNLGLTRSAVAKAVGRLERQTGTRLFQRTTRVVTLTHEGQALYARATDTIKELEAALDDLTGRGEEPRGVLRLTAPDAYGRSKVLPVLTRFLTAWPKLEADVIFNDRIVDVVAEGFDLALQVGALDIGQDLISRVISRHRVSYCASPEYLARHGEPAKLEELRRHTCLQFVQRGQRQPWWGRMDNGEIAAFDTEARVRFDSCLAIRDAAVDGLGILQMPDYLVEKEVSEGRLQRVLETKEPEPVPIIALYPSKRYLAPKVRLFIDCLVCA
jgi:DNA-binding transcriptional LysR family regulator